MKAAIKTLNIFLFTSAFLQCATIRGFVIERATGKPISNAYISIDFDRSSDHSDNDGFFVLLNVKPGEYILAASLAGYLPFSDTINIKTINETVDLTIVMGAGYLPVDTVTEFDGYHRYLKDYVPAWSADNNFSILEIILDSLGTTGDNSLVVYSRLFNRTDTVIYVIKNYLCLRMFAAIISNSRGEEIGSNCMICCTGEKVSPDSADFLEIKPFSSIKYPVVLYLYRFERYPPDNYKINLSYEYKPKKNLQHFVRSPGGERKYEVESYYYLMMALRGNFISTNYIVFNNLDMIK